jgi:hypothetical protein
MHSQYCLGYPQIRLILHFQNLQTFQMEQQELYWGCHICIR